MKRTTRLCATLGLITAFAAVGMLSGCGSAQAEPIEVTYYYLPG